MSIPDHGAFAGVAIPLQKRSHRATRDIEDRQFHISTFRKVEAKFRTIRKRIASHRQESERIDGQHSSILRNRRLLVTIALRTRDSGTAWRVVVPYGAS